MTHRHLDTWTHRKRHREREKERETHTHERKGTTGQKDDGAGAEVSHSLARASKNRQSRRHFLSIHE